MLDTNGQTEKSTMISYITNDDKGIVNTYDSKRHDFEDGDFVKFSEIKGMTEVNGQEFQIKVIGSLSKILLTINQPCSQKLNLDNF